MFLPLVFFDFRVLLVFLVGQVMLNVILNLVVIAKGVFCLDLNFDAQTCIQICQESSEKCGCTPKKRPTYWICASMC